MRFSIFPKATSQMGELCTREKYLEIANTPHLLELCQKIAAEPDPDKRGRLKKGLPAVTWQSFFPGRRISQEAEPSGLYMLDIDHVEDPYKLYCEKVVSRIKELNIVYVGKTASCHGLRIVAKCSPVFTTIEACQRDLADRLGVEFDGVCKDWARCSFLVHDSYTYYMNAQGIWADEPEPMTQYKVISSAVPNSPSTSEEPSGKNATKSGCGSAQNTSDGGDIDQREGLFGGSDDYRGVPYKRIIEEWFRVQGGEPHEGDRNVKLFKLATRLRYITDFNETTILRVLPDYGLPQEEIRSLVRSALQTPRASDMPMDLKLVLENIDKCIKLGHDDDNEETPDIITSTKKVPILPPVFKEWYDNAPDDFKEAVVLAQLPILGALGSRLRSKYLDGRMHSPSFQVSLEAPQASGKSFLTRLVDYELSRMIDSDEEQRAKERAYNEKLAEMKLTATKLSDKQKEEMGERPKGIVRYVPATMSITMLLKRMEGARGLHLFAFAEEIDTVTKAFKRGFSSFSDALRVSFDNGLYGQDYASTESYSGILQLYYNCLFSGTPKAMRRFYPDVEDGLVSRVLFVSLPDQFGKPMPIWKEFTPEQKNIVDLGLERLNEITLQGEEVQPEHIMDMGWLNDAMAEWIKQQQIEAVKTNDRTRDIFCRRSAVVGFRAGMVAWFLWEENKRAYVKKKVINFATWVANCMLNQHLLRFNVTSNHSNVNPFEEVFNQLPDEFSRRDAEERLALSGVDTPVKQVLYKWKLLGIIEETKRTKNPADRRVVTALYRKIK